MGDRSRSRSPARRDYGDDRGGRGDGGGKLAGTAARWNERGFGFIKPNEGGDDLFCHVSQILDGNSLREGDAVTYVKVFDERRGQDRAEQITGGITQDRDGGGGGPRRRAAEGSRRRRRGRSGRRGSSVRPGPRSVGQPRIVRGPGRRRARRRAAANLRATQATAAATEAERATEAETSRSASTSRRAAARADPCASILTRMTAAAAAEEAAAEETATTIAAAEARRGAEIS